MIIEQPLKVATVRDLVSQWLQPRLVAVELGLPEWDDRLNRWRVPLISTGNGSEPIGEVRVRSTGEIAETTDLDLSAQRARLVKTEKKKRVSRCGEIFIPAHPFKNHPG